MNRGQMSLITPSKLSLFSRSPVIAAWWEELEARGLFDGLRAGVFDPELAGHDVEAPSSEEFNQELRVVELVRERRRE